MNISLICELVTAANQGHGFLEVLGFTEAREVRLMVSAGLVKATELNPFNPDATTITEVTDAGQQFLRALRPYPIEVAV